MIGKRTANVLRFLRDNRDVTFEQLVRIVGSEDDTRILLDYLMDNDYLVQHVFLPETKPDVYVLYPSGEAVLEDYDYQRLERRVTIFFSVAALVISIISLLKQ